jgi:cytochrome c peroxidase
MKSILGSISLAALLAPAQFASAGPRIADMKEYPNDTGVSQSFSANGALDTRNPFFQVLGSNGRSCITCHQPDQGWSVTPMFRPSMRGARLLACC